MKTITKLLGVAMVGMLAFTGFAAASTGAGLAPAANADTNSTDVDRPLDGSNSPWATDDERLELFQERFDLTDEQVEEIQEAVESEMDADASRETIRNTVTEKLQEFGVDGPTLGPTDDRVGTGPHGQNAGNGNAAGAGAGHGAAGGNGPGNAQGAGPHGPADGSCMA
ncbi:hypothetical protein [Halanaeroarchaeum sulfurireducens]|uniref:Uncharacterized protein n=1 Tax=Halanaeroarchaeum sulfurireducens TaxID=1604004 RepID=A0A0F7PEM6_9EURY|nr:hypothetical protein [Halanaeroarchaeum sulfurireducens]AKH97768.1 hypothetical protein HLASF_1282 [Halanaeroarchaeum sulfurireducens]ALG82163.1 hypothetical protein HLASA_1270 [Halanaeroarchaeum sulfurireducens]